MTMTMNGSIRGLTLISAANIAYCAMVCLIRYMSNVNASSTTLFRFTVGLGIMGLLAMSGTIRLRFVDKRGLFLRGLLGSVSVFIGFVSIVKLGVIRASLIMYTYPVFSALFGAVILHERIGLLASSWESASWRP
jgi:drug/metabolite transporter (DMT)-like permease